MRSLSRGKAHRRGQGLVEYGVTLASIVIVVVLALSALGTTTGNMFNSLNSTINGAIGGGAPASNPTPAPSIVHPSYKAAVLSTAPVAYWRLGEASGIIAVDETGAHSGEYLERWVATPPISVSGLLTGDTNAAMSLSLSQAWLVWLGSVMDPTASDFTMAAWINMPDTSGRNVIFGTGSGGLDFNIVLGRVGLWATSYGDSIDSTPLLDGISYFVVATYIQSTHTVSYYVNGAPGYSGTWAPTITPGVPVVAIGVDPAVGLWFNGTIDEPAIWNRALSSAEIAALYAVGTGH